VKDPGFRPAAVLKGGIKMKRALALALAGLACGKIQAPVGDAAVERPATETGPVTPPVAPPLVVDFAIEGCPAFDADKLTCTGTAPMALRFVPLVTTPVTQYFWDFGDDPTAFDTGQVPSHTYTVPGVYTVRLVVSGSDGMVVSRAHADLVTVTANSLGDACDLDRQCSDKLTCLCPSTSACDFGAPHGICAATCPSGTCGDGQVCSALATAPSPSGAHEDWQQSVCLRRCDHDTDCNAQLHCRLLPPGPGGTTWVFGCFGDLPADVGLPCLDATSRLRDDLCTSGICANLGARGVCTMACSDRPCAPGSECAVLGDGRKLCLRPCTDGFKCGEDPLLTCALPGTGDLGFQLVNSGPSLASKYCAPRPCTSDTDCAPSGTCDSPDSGGHCVARRD
jgi:PKD repeat protein